MPIYEFKCKECGKEFEELVLSSSQEVECPACESGDVERLMSRCRVKSGGFSPDLGQASAPSSSSGGCAGCSGGNCSSCH